MSDDIEDRELRLAVDQNTAYLEEIISTQEVQNQSLATIINELTAEPDDAIQLAEAIRKMAADIAEIKKTQSFILTLVSRTQ